MAIAVIDVAPLLKSPGCPAERLSVAGEIEKACRELGFFYVIGHGVDEELQERLLLQSRRFFALPPPDKLAIHMSRGGRAWRGFFPVGEELTSGQPDRKEGIYFGQELDASHPRVRSGTPLHGRNLFPAEPPELRETVLLYMDAMTRLGHQLMAGIALSLELPQSYFADRYTADPLTLFRIFNYPPDPAGQGAESGWGVGEHTDYGLLTILKQDDAGGLEVKSRARWLAAPPIPGSFVCNIGDMLDRMTGGRYRSTPHRVRNVSGRSRLSFPFFFDPGWEARIEPIALARVGPAPGPGPWPWPWEDDQTERWDRKSVHAFSGTYGDYVLAKVGKVFPALRQDVL